MALARKRSQRRRDKLKAQIDLLAHAQGKAFTEAENRQAVLTYLILCQENPEAGKVWLIERTGAVLGRGPRVIYDLVTHWQKTREIIVHDPANRGRGSPKFVFRPKGFHPAVIEWLKARIESSLKAGRTVRVPWLAHDLFAEWKLASSRQTLYAVLKRLVGANWGRCVVLKGNFDPTSGKAKQARVAFIKAYAHALKLQAETKTIIVYFDETYLNTGHVSKMSWHLNGHRGLSTQAKGRRLIVLHALTKDGWVRGKRADGSVCELTDAEAQVLRGAANCGDDLGGQQEANPRRLPREHGHCDVPRLG